MSGSLSLWGLKMVGKENYIHKPLLLWLPSVFSLRPLCETRKKAALTFPWMQEQLSVSHDITKALIQIQVNTNSFMAGESSNAKQVGHSQGQCVGQYFFGAFKWEMNWYLGTKSSKVTPVREEFSSLIKTQMAQRSRLNVLRNKCPKSGNIKHFQAAVNLRHNNMHLCAQENRFFFLVRG